jgi:hypothetical protein
VTPLKAPYLKISTPKSRARRRAARKPEGDSRLVEMENDGCPWEEAYAAFPDRTSGTINVRCSTKLKSRLA